MTDAATVRRGCAAMLATCAVALGACGDDDDGGEAGAPTPAPPAQTQAPQSGPGEALEINAVEDGGLSFSEEAVQAAAGPLEIVMTNPADAKAPHAIAVTGEGVEQEGETVQAGGTSRVSFPNLQPGEYTFYCPVGNHREQGMEGTLTIE